MAKFSDKWRIIRKVISSDECILVSRKGDDTEYYDATDSIFFFDLFCAIQRYVPKWYGAWLTNNNRKK